MLRTLPSTRLLPVQPCRATRLLNPRARHGSQEGRFFQVYARHHGELQTQSDFFHGNPNADYHRDKAIPTHNHKVWIDALRPDFDDYIARIRQDEDSEPEPENKTQGSNKSPSTLQNSLSHLSLDERVMRVLQRSYHADANKLSPNGHQNLSNEPEKTILAYLGLEEGNWAMVSWITRVVTENVIHAEDDLGESIVGYAPLLVDHRSHLPPPGSQSIEELANNFIWFKQNVAQSEETDNQSPQSAISATMQNRANFSNLARKDYANIGQLNPKSVLTRDAVGILLHGLGQMIMHASTTASTIQSQDVMNHVLDTMAILHHNGIIPEFTYRATSSELYSAKAAPSYLDELFSPLLSSILDAEWNLFQDTPEHASYASGAQTKIPGFEFSDHHNPMRILPFAHSIWLELILWICLRGGYLPHGFAILQQIASTRITQQSNPWTIASWRDASPSTSEDEFIIPSRSVSAELVLAYAEAIKDLQPCLSSHDHEPTQQTLQLLRTLYDGSGRSRVYNWSTLFAQTTGDQAISNQLPDISDSSRDRAWHIEVAASGGDLLTVVRLLNDLINDLGAGERVQQEGCTLDLADYISPDALGRVIQSIVDSGRISTDLRKAIKKVYAFCSTDHIEKNAILGPAFANFFAHRAQVKQGRRVSRAKALMDSSMKHDNFKLARLISDMYLQKTDVIKDSLVSVIGRVHISEDWHQRILVAMISTIMLMQKNNVEWSNDTKCIEISRNLQSYLKQSLEREDMSHLLPSTYTIIGLLASVNESWNTICSSVLYESVSSFKKHSNRPRAFLKRVSDNSVNRTRLINATLLPNLCAKLLTTIAVLEGPDSLLRIWKQWCRQPGSKTSDTRTRIAFKDDIAMFIIQQPFEPTVPMIRVLINRCNLDSNVEDREAVITMLRHLELSDQAIEEMLAHEVKVPDVVAEQIDESLLSSSSSSLEDEEPSPIHQLIDTIADPQYQIRPLPAKPRSRESEMAEEIIFTKPVRKR